MSDKVFCVLLFFCLSAIGSVLPQQTAEIPKLPAPFLLTPAGQTPDTLMVNLAGERAKLDMRFERFAGPKDLQGIKSVVLVIGASTNGGSTSDQQFQDPAGGLNIEEEIRRVENLIEEARERRIPLVGMHIGGSDRRDEVSDSVIHRVAPKVNYLVVLKEGDHDGVFKKIAYDNKIPLIYIRAIVDLEGFLPVMFAPASK